MTKISEKSRNLLRKFFIFLGVAAISLVFQACYGPPPIREPVEEDQPRSHETELTGESDTKE